MIDLFCLSICMNIAEFRASVEEATEFLESLARELVHTKFCETTAEAQLYIVPAFLRFGLLPSRPKRGVGTPRGPLSLISWTQSQALAMTVQAERDRLLTVSWVISTKQRSMKRTC